MGRLKAIIDSANKANLERSIMPAPQRFFDPEDKAYKPFLERFDYQPGGRYLEMGPDGPRDVTGEYPVAANISVGPDGKPKFKASQENLEAPPDTKGVQVKTNLFKKKAGWKWTKPPKGYDPDPDGSFPLISVEARGKHYYALETDFPEGVDLSRYASSSSEPRLRPTRKGDVTLGKKVGEISVRGKKHPVYDKAVVKTTVPIAAAGIASLSSEEAEAGVVGSVRKNINEVLIQGQDADRGLGSLPGASGRTFKKQADETIARVYDNLRTQKDQYDEPVFDELPVGKLSGKTGRSGVTGVTRYRMPEGYTGSLEKLGRAAPDLIEIAPDADGAKYFSDQITSAKKANKFGASVYVYPQKEYKDMRLFITDDGSAGYALKPNGDVVSAFSSGTHKGVAQNILLHAVEQGGVKLDAFDTVLPDLYSTMGFRESGRIPWLDKEAPEDWNKAVFRAFNAGEPDVSFMAYSRDPAIPVEPRYESSYESAVEAQDRDVEDFRRSPLLNIINSGGKAGMTALGASALLAPEESEASGLGSIFRGQRISTRVPTAKGATENPLTDNLVINRQALEAAPKAFDINARYVSGYPTVRTGAKTSAGRVDAFTAEAVDNLIWLYNQAPPAVRNIGKNWYVGANRISAELADKYGISRESASAVLAALSPQKDWYQNVSLAERVIHGYKKSSGKVLDADSLATAKTIYSKPQFADNIKVIADTPFDDLNDVQKAMYLRSLDQTHNNRGYQIINPNGDRVGQAFSQNTGEPNTAAWGSNAEIAKAVRVIEDPSIENISQQMGGAHKVRNFFNNISDPKYSIDNPEIGDVTIDTHAVAADQIMPLSGNSAPVGAAFGTAKGVASSAQTGAKGTYGLHADAYRIAANELGIQPRELQSVTWETVRSLFPKEFKTKGNVSEILEIWKLYNRGKLSKGLARELILDKAGGIPNPGWADGLDTAASGPRGLGANTGELSFSGIPGRQNTRRSDAGRNILAAGLPVGIISALGIVVSEDAEAGGLGSLPAATKEEAQAGPFEAAEIFSGTKAAPKKESLGLPSLAGQLGLGAMSEIAGALAGGTVGFGEYLRGALPFIAPGLVKYDVIREPVTGESIRNIREGVSDYVGGLYDAGPEAQAVGQEIMQGIGETIAPLAKYAMEGPIMDEYGLNMLPLIAQKLGIPAYQLAEMLFSKLPEREQEAAISASDVLL